MIVVPYQREHVAQIRAQHAQANEVKIGEAPAVEAGDAWSAFVDGQCIGCGGLFPMFPHRAYAWALLGVDAGPHMLAITREVRFRLDSSPFVRVEMAVDHEFPEGRRWAEMLGFEAEVLARAYLPGPRDAWIYIKVK